MVLWILGGVENVIRVLILETAFRMIFASIFNRQ